MERVILHSDINHCYAQIEEMKYPQLRSVPMAVGGHEELRHGIILAKNDLAKKYQIKTGESLREAYAKCPNLCIIHPHYEDYMYYTEKVKDIYREYSDCVESYGLDEAWIDLTHSTTLFGDGVQIAKTIQNRVLQELGLCVSIGVSFNKIFAKLGSDMDKHLGLTQIRKDNFKELIWNLAVDDLFYVGRATAKKLHAYSIDTIGDLAGLPLCWMRNHFGKMGELLSLFANGKDNSSIALSTHQEPIKSIGNGITAPRDIRNFEEAKGVFYVLTESVSARLREQGLKGDVIAISLRNKNLQGFSRQRKIACPSDLTQGIMPIVLNLLKTNYDFQIPLRSIGVTVSGLKGTCRVHQLDLFRSEEETQKQRKLEETMELIRTKFGFKTIQRCGLLMERDLTNFNPKQDHGIHPQSFF